MLPPDKIKQDLLVLVDGLRNPPGSVWPLFFLSPKLRTKFNELTEQCITLYRDVESLPANAGTWEHSQRLFVLELRCKWLRILLSSYPPVFLLYVGFVLILVLLPQAISFIRKVLGVDAPERLITFGIAGAFIYLATSMLAQIDKSSESSPVAKAADFTIRIFLAIVVPVILVALFFNEQSTIGEVKVSPELVSFACGYSAKLVVDIINKIVEKVSKMIQTI